MPPSAPRRPGDIDPSGATTIDQLAALLRKLRVRAGNPALREIERLGTKRGHVLPRSTVAGVLTGRHRPRRDVLLALIDVFGVPEHNVPTWTATWEMVVAGQPGEAFGESDGRAPEEPDGQLPQHVAPPVKLDSEPDIWRFPSDEPVTIACSRLPDNTRSQLRFSDPRDPDYIDLLTYGDPDALLHLYGHLRALNPTLDVQYSTTAEMHPREYSNHLVVLGGTDFNLLTRDILSTLNLPVRMPQRTGDSNWFGLEVVDEDETLRFSARLDSFYDDSRVLHEDVILFFRGTNPINPQRTVTMCAGLYARGTLAAVRCLTDPTLGPVNHSYLRKRFAGNRHFGFIARAFVINGIVVPPNLTVPEHRLYEWTRPE